MAFNWIMPTKHPGHYRVIHKFGANEAVGTTFAPIAIGGIYRTPQPSGATTLRVKAGNANDTAAGSGAREVTLQGVNASGTEITEAVPTNGIAAGAASTNSFLRLFRAFISKSGTYGTQSAGSHTAAVVIENGAGTEDWLTINATGYPRGQSEVGVYTIPSGYVGYVLAIAMSVNTGKTVDFIFYQHQNIIETSAPYSAVREIVRITGVTENQTNFAPPTPWGPFPALTDVGFMGKVSAGTAEAEVDFNIILIKNEDHIPDAYERS